MSKVRVTHVEIRRVQNGYVVMAMDYAEDYGPAFQQTGARASYVAKDEEEVKLVIGNILASAELDWMPTVDLPLIAMKHGVSPSRVNKIDTDIAYGGMAAAPGAQPYVMVR